MQVAVLACLPYILRPGHLLQKNRFWFLLPGLVMGFAFGLAQQLRGAHFISQDLWSVSIDWFGALLLLKLAWRFRSPVKLLNHKA